jgi:hypothetical protein
MKNEYLGKWFPSNLLHQETTERFLVLKILEEEKADYEPYTYYYQLRWLWDFGEVSNSEGWINLDKYYKAYLENPLAKEKVSHFNRNAILRLFTK